MDSIAWLIIVPNSGFILNSVTTETANDPNVRPIKGQHKSARAVKPSLSRRPLIDAWQQVGDPLTATMTHFLCMQLSLIVGRGNCEVTHCAN
jgi:hypothetical protein